MSRVFVCGDTHADISWSKLNSKNFPIGKELTKDDYIIICGDFGGVWGDKDQDKYILDWYESKPWTTLFVDGNHENHDILDSYPVSEWHGGKVHFIRPSVIHLMRGQVFEINGCTFFTMGGAQSTDKWARKEGESWWAREMPSDKEYDEAIKNLERVGQKVDFIISHCASDSVEKKIVCDPWHNKLTNFFEVISSTVEYTWWFCGHYHTDIHLDEHSISILYNEYEKLREAEERKRRRKIIGYICGGIVMFIAIILLCASCTKVPTGYTGIVTTFGRVEDYTFAPGLHWKSPFQHVVKMDNRTQKVAETMQAFSADIQQVDLSISINYSIDQMTAQNLYRTVGEKYYGTIIYPRLLEDTKAVFSKYTAEDLINNREVLSQEITDLVSKDLDGKGIVISAISVQDIDFTDAFTNAVEAKQVAAQNKLTAETQQAQLTMQAEQEAARQVIKAQADAEQAKIAAEADLEVTKIQADAAEYAGQKEAAKNRAISEWLTPELLKYYYILQWDGVMPVYMLGDDMNFMMGVE